MGQTKRSGVFKNVFMHKNRGLTRPQRVPGVSSTYSWGGCIGLTDALRRPTRASHVYSLAPACAACQRPCRALCCVLSYVSCLLCALCCGAWPEPMAVACVYVRCPSCWLGHAGPLLLGVYRITPIGRPCVPPEIRGYTRPCYMGVCFWG